MLTQSFIYLPSIIGVIGIGLFVLARSKQVVFRLFGLFSLSLAVWLFFQYLTDARVGSGELWLQLASVAVTLMAALFLLFVYTYPNHYALPRSRFILALLPLVLLLPFSFSSLLISDVTYTD